MKRWLLSLFRRAPKPSWQYVDHTYTGLDSGAMTHGYIVTFGRGKDRMERVFKLHAARLEPRPNDALVHLFKHVAAKLND